MAVALVLLAIGPMTAVAGPLPTIASARLGFNGTYKVGHWTPIEILVRGGDQPAIASASVYLPDGDDVLTRYSSTPQQRVQLLPGVESRLVMFGKVGRDVSQFDIRLELDSGKVIDETIDTYNPVVGKATSVAAGGKLYLTLGHDIGIPVDSNQQGHPEIVKLTSVADLPTQWYGYDSANAVVITTSNPTALKMLQSDGAAIAALEQWIELGGHLLLCVGAEAREVLDPKGPLARFAPGRLVDVETVRSGDALEEYSDTTHRIPPTGRGESIQLQVPTFDRTTGVVEVVEGSIPLIIRTPRGLGQVTFVACDLDARPLSSWSGRGALVDKLLGHRKEDKPSTPSYANAVQNDLSGQLRSALDQFPGVRVVPFWIVAMLILFYIVLVGPGDYFFVRNVLKRMELTWITFPTIVLVTSLAAYFGASWLKGSSLKLNQVDIVDIDEHSGLVRGATWVNVFSPSTASYSLSLAPKQVSGQSTDPSVLFSWLGTPGNYWRGMNSPASTHLFTRRYDSTVALNGLHDVPIDVWSTKPFFAEWYARRARLHAPALKLATDSMLTGTVTNSLDVPLEKCLLIYDRWTYDLGDLAAGAKADLKIGDRRNDLQVALKDYDQIRSNKYASLTLQVQPYNSDSDDVQAIVRMMMFHAAAGKTGYTQLHHDQMSWIDLSDQLQLGRAILLGIGPRDQTATQLLRNGQPLTGHEDQHWTYYRIVLPVDSGSRAAAGETK